MDHEPSGRPTGTGGLDDVGQYRREKRHRVVIDRVQANRKKWGMDTQPVREELDITRGKVEELPWP